MAERYGKARVKLGDQERKADISRIQAVAQQDEVNP